MTSLKMVGYFVACTKFHSTDEMTNPNNVNDESNDMNRWENDGGRTLDSTHGSTHN